MKIIVIFTKKDSMAYISHLDLQRLLLRSFRMAGVRPLYSSGFNPHPKMSIALPLSLGISSNREYCEADIPAETLPEGLTERLNAILPQGIKVRDIRPKREDIKRSIASYVRSASYEIIAPRFEGAAESINSCLEQRTFLIMKKSVKTGKEEQRDIRGQIIRLSIIREFNEQMMLEAVLSAGSGGTLNPLVFIRSFYEFSRLDLDEDRLSILRTGINFDRKLF